MREAMELIQVKEFYVVHVLSFFLRLWRSDTDLRNIEWFYNHVLVNNKHRVPSRLRIVWHRGYHVSGRWYLERYTDM